MTIRNSRDKSRNLAGKVSEPTVAQQKARKALRHSLFEPLEVRNLLAVAPQLIGIQPNNSDLIESGVVRDVAPRELTFRFDDSQVINAATTDGIRLTRSGGDSTFGLASVASDFGSNGKVDIQLTMRNPGQTLAVTVLRQDLGVNVSPRFASSSSVELTITLNSNANTPTTASQLINAINSTSTVNQRVSAKINGGFADARLGAFTGAVPQINVNSSNDTIVRPGFVLVGSAPNENEVTFRFAESLPDDFYRIEVFGFDDASSGIVGLRNVVAGQANGDLFAPTLTGTRQDTIDFRLDLGSQVTGVVPQPVVRNANGSISQQRDTVVVYFDSDKLLVENDSNGNPTLRSAENPDFYQLIYTADTVRNIDDGTNGQVVKPTKVSYNASNNTATLTFSRDIDDLRPVGAPRAAFRLRVGTRESIPFAPIARQVAELGDTVTTADNLGVIGSSSALLTSLILTSDIKSTTLGLDRLGASDDPGHRDLGNAGFENHINENFGVDTNPAITQIFYNFKSDYVAGFNNSISEVQKVRVREALQIWSNYLGVQFTESATLGMTFSTGVLAALQPGPQPPGISIQSEPSVNFRVRIDSSFNSSLLVMDAGRAWNNNYGEDYFRIAMTAIGMMLGLEHAGDLPDSTLLSINSAYLNSLPNTTTAAVTNFEQIFPGAQDILHGRFIHRPDSSDIDLYRFEVDFGANGSSRTGEFVAETFAERAKSVSDLDTNLKLYKQQQATAVSNFNAVEDLAIQFTAKAPGQLGNHLQIFVTQTDRGSSTQPGIQVSANTITVELNSRAGSETTVADLIAAINGNASASALVQVQLLRGANSIKIGGREIVYSPIELLGGKLDLVATNDDYFSEDSLLRLSLGSGVYYVGVSASGNNSYDPVVPNTGNGGRTDGNYDLRLTFRAQTDSNDTIQDTIGQSPGDFGRSLDGDADGVAGGVYDFWFETRPLNRVLSVNNNGAVVDGQVITLTGSTGVIRRFELSTDAFVGSGNIVVSITSASTPSQIASALTNAINAPAQSVLLVSAVANGSQITLSGERSVEFSVGSSGITAEGRMIFVDKLASANSDGSQARPFNNLQGIGVPNAFSSTVPGDIVRIVGNGGTDANLSTVADNFAYEFGFGLLPNSILSDGVALEVPKGVIAMVDAGAVFKSRRSYISVGSSNTGIDRGGANLQVLGTPLQSVYFTSWLDESVGRDSYGPTTIPANGDWGGIIFQRDVDRSQGRIDKEDQGIFLNYVNHADIRFGGSGGIVIDSAQQVVNPIQIIDGRPTLTHNTITRSADAAISATPNSFDETLFTDQRFQSNGAFTPDYDRVGPDIHGNRLVNNSLNGLFIKVQTLPGEAPRTVTLAARFDDIDVTHIITENLIIQGTPGGNLSDTTTPETTFVTVGALSGGNLAIGTYNYRVTFVDQFGAESLPSAPSVSITLSTTGSISVAGLPSRGSGFAFVRAYRSDATGAGQYKLVAQLDSTKFDFIDRGQDLGGRLTIPAVPATATVRPRLDASLVVDPGAVVKLEGARIELGQGVQFIAEGTEDKPIAFTSKLDDRTGAGGTFDTNNDNASAAVSRPAPGNWGGIYVSSGADVAIDHSLIAYAGGVTRLEGTFRSFNALELQQGTARIANSTFEFNANGVGGQGPVDRFGRLNNEQAVVLVRGSSPIFINNVFQNNSTTATGSTRSSAITIDANSLNNELQGDRGRQTGFIDRLRTFDNNRGPLFRGNSFNLNDLNGLKIRADNRAGNTATGILSIDELPSDGLTVQSVWDDTDIVHVLFDGIFVSNLAHDGGLRLQSSPTESLVVKMSGQGSNFDPLRGAGFTATGFKSSIEDRVGGTIHVIGQPGFPVIITSYQDDSVGAGLRPDGKPQTDTNNDGIASIPRPGDWRGILLDQNSNDRNVGMILETEAPNAVAPGVNGGVLTAQVLGQLATNGNNTDENLRLGFVVKGVLSQPEDVDVYSFTGVAGTEVWIDVDNTSYTLDSVVELLDANGTLLARSDNSLSEGAGTSSIVTTPGIAAARVNPLVKQTVGNIRRNADGSLKEEGSLNPRDAGLRVILPGATNTRSGYFFRVRSASTNPGNFSGGLTAGSYEVQIRLREAQEFAGSIVTGADIRYATNGIHLRGLPGHSPLLGEAGEDESVRTGENFASNDLPWSYESNIDPVFGNLFNFNNAPVSTGNRPQYVGNILKSDRGAISVAGNLTTNGDTDFYRFSLTEQDLVNNVNSVANLVFDLDYADGLNRADTSLSVYRLGGTPGAETWQLIYVGEGSNIADDQRAPLSVGNAGEFSRGSIGINDPFVNTAALTAGDYLVAVTGSNLVPSEFSSAGTNVLFRADRVDLSRANSFLVDLTNVLATDLPRLQFNYASLPAGGYTVTINGIDNVTGLPATVTTVLRGTGSFPPFLSLNGDLSRFAGSFVTVLFPTTNIPDPPAAQPNIANVLVLVNSLGAGAERTPFARLSTPQLVTLFTTPLAIPSRQEVAIDLSGYSAGDMPAAYFNYNRRNNDYDVTIESAAGSSIPVFADGPLIPDGLDRQAKVDLRAFAGETSVKLVFTPTGLNPNADVWRVMVGFAERGEDIASVTPKNVAVRTPVTPRDQSDFALGPTGTIQPLFVANPIVSTAPQTGAYQLEIRRVDAPTGANRIDQNTNNRDAGGFALNVSNGASINDGDTFLISDGASFVEFEFNSTGSVTPGRVPISFTSAPADPAAVIAGRIRDAINSSSVQARLNVQASSGDGVVTGTQSGNRVNLVGAAKVTFSNAFSGSVLVFAGNGDQNVNRDQGQTIVNGNFIRQARDYGVWSETGLADYDPRDLIDTYSGGLSFVNFSNTGAVSLIDNGAARVNSAIMQSRPRTVGSSPGPARNLPQLNNDLVGGFNTGVVVSNNVLEEGGLGGVHIAGENPIWMITPVLVPSTDNLVGENAPGTHFGGEVDDGDQFFFDSGRTRVGVEFDDIAGAGTGAPNFGSGVTGGNGWRPTNVPASYREDAGSLYLRAAAGTAWGFSALETVHALRDAVLGSILVTNGTTQNVTATVAMSLLAPDRLAQLTSTGVSSFLTSATLTDFPGLNWANRPALYLEGVTNVYFQGQRGGRPWDIRRIDRAETPQPFARILNNTIIGNDGRASFGDVVPAVTGTPQEPNDLLNAAVGTQIGTGNTESFTVNAILGDNAALTNNLASDVDFYQVRLNQGERIRIDVDSSLTVNPVDTVLQLFDASGNRVNLAGTAPTPITLIDDQEAPGEAPSNDPYIDFTAPTSGIYYVAVSGQGNIGFNPRFLVDPITQTPRQPGDTGDYTINLSLSRPIESTITNDLLVNATQTRAGTGINPQGYSLAAVIGDNSNLASDVDLYQFKLDIGDRVRIDVDTVLNPDPSKSAVDTVLQIFDASGRLVNLIPGSTNPVTLVDNAVAPGETLGIDPYIDFTATASGIYYASVSGKGNIGFDPQSSAARKPGAGTGLYTISIAVAQPQEFTITVEDDALYQSGDTFTIYQVADLAGTTTTAQVFEFTTQNPYTGPNIPIYIGPDYFIPDIARAIAGAINAANLSNRQGLHNGAFAAANPVAAVSAVALGGIDGVQPGLRLFPSRDDGGFISISRTINGETTRVPTNSVAHGAQGIGHDRRDGVGGSTGSEVFGAGPGRSEGDGTTERFVVIRNAAAIESTAEPRGGQPNRRSIQVDPDLGANYNMNQLIPESGVLVSAGSSPTILNNVFYNVQTPIVREETRSLAPSPTDPLSQNPLPFGSPNVQAVDRNAKPAEIIVGGNTYQFIETQTAFNRSGFGIQASPTNIPNTQQDFNFVASNSEQLFVNAQAGRYLPASGSRIIDSSLDSLTERDKFNTIKSAAGIAPSPIFAPSRDAYGQFRIDDPDVAPPLGLGANGFKDRGAIDRADFTGPTALLLNPIDNDSELRDRDPSVSYVQLQNGVYPEFRLQLSDAGDSADPFPGVGIDDDTVLGPNQAPLRLSGAALTISENGRALREGIDYVFAYNSTTKEIILTPLAGVWRNDRVYEIKLNNRDRFVIQAPDGSRVSDGDQFQIIDSLGGKVNFEFDSGYRLQLPSSLSLVLPIAGGGAGGVLDGDRFTIIVPRPSPQPSLSRTFELDRNGNTLPTSVPISFLSTDSREQLATKILAAITSDTELLALPSESRLSPRILANGSIFLGATSGVSLGVTGVALSVPLTTVGFRIPTQGPLPGGVTDGQIFTVSDGFRTVTFEIDTDNVFNANNQRVDTSASSTASDVTDQILQAILAANLNLQPTKVGSDSILLGLTSSGSASTGTSQLLLVGVSKTITDGQSLTVDYQPPTGPVVTRVFEFDNNGTVDPNSTRIGVSSSLTEEDIGVLLAQAITDGGLNLNAVHLRNGNISVGGTPQHTITINPGTEIGLFGTPGVTPSTSLDLLGSLVIAAPINGASIIDGSTFSITNNGQTVTFEFDTNFASVFGNTRITYSTANTASEIAGQIAAAIQTSVLGIVPSLLTNGRVDIGFIADSQVLIQSQTGLTLQRGIVSDGEFFTISNGVNTVTFEFDNTSLNNGRTTGSTPILFTSTSTLLEIATSMQVAISNAGLGATVNLNGTNLAIDDTPRFVYTTATAPSIRQNGLPGGVVVIPFIQDATFTGEQMQAALVKAINASRTAGDTSLSAIARIGDSLFVENAVTISDNVTNYFLGGVQDLADNNLRANRINNETQFTILMPGASLDFGDAPDPFTTTSGRYPTVFSSNGARHVLVGENEVQVVGWTAGDLVTGSFTLSHAGQTTGDISVPASAATVQAALESLTTVGVGNVMVELLEQPSGSPNVTYRITFRGVLASLDVPQTKINLSTTGTNTTPVSSFEQTITEGQSALRLGRLESSEADGLPTPTSEGDSGDDGVTFSSTIVLQPGLPAPGFNRNITTSVTVTASAPGLLDAWIDFNFDGDWDDPNEQILVSREFTSNTLVQTFAVTIPANTPAPSVPTLSVARFRLSTEGGLQPTGLATNGEVEDYAITIVPGTPPVATNNNYSTFEDALTGLVVPTGSGVLANDPDVDSASKFVVDSNPNLPGIQPLVAPQHGTLTLNVDGSFTYVPELDFFGVDTFVYTASDGVLLSVLPATVTITVAEINDIPNAPLDAGQTVSLDENQVYDVTESELLRLGTVNAATPGPANESNQTLKITRVDPNSEKGGTVTLSGGRIRYTPPASFIGTDTFTYLIVDNGTTLGAADPLVTTATITFTISDRNDPPIAGIDSLTTNEDTAISRPTTFFLSNDTPGSASESSQTLSFVSVEPTSTNGGTVTLIGTTVTYTPATNFTGTDTFFYNVRDNGLTGGLPDPRTTRGTVSVTVTSVNDLPQVVAPIANISVVEDAADRTIDLKTVFSDVDILTAGDVLTYSIASNSRSSLVTPSIGANGILTIDFLPDQNGTASIVVRATDKAGAFVDTPVSISVSAVSDSPRIVANIPDRNLQEDAPPIVLQLSPNFIFDPDVATNNDTLTFSVTPSSGSFYSATIVNNTLTITLLANQSGQATFTVRGVDGSGQAISDTFDLIVAAVNDAPLTLARNYTVPSNGSLQANDVTGTATPTANDNSILVGASDVEGDSFNAILVRQPTRGNVSLNPNGTFTYTPATGSTPGQSDTFTYRAVDSQGAQGLETTVTINFTTLNPSPHQNQTDKFDVNADGSVSPIDALVVINYLNRNGSNIPVGSLTYQPAPYRDVNGDFFLAPIDVLQVINELNRRSRASGEGEATATVSAPIIVAPNPVNSSETWSENVGVSQSNMLIPMESVTEVQKPTATEMRDQAIMDVVFEENDPIDYLDVLPGNKKNRENAVDAAWVDILGGK